MTLTCTILIAAALTTGMPSEVPEASDRTMVAAAFAATSAPRLHLPQATSAPAEDAEWMVDRTEPRPGALMPMYATFAGLQALDVYSTRNAIGSGAHEANPLMRAAARRTGTMVAVKALAGAATIYFTERAWKKNRKGAVTLMAVINGVSAAVSVRNLRNERR